VVEAHRGFADSFWLSRPRMMMMIMIMMEERLETMTDDALMMHFCLDPLFGDDFIHRLTDISID